MKKLKTSNNIIPFVEKKEYYERDKTGKKFITAFQLFKILMDNVGSLITPMEMTGDIMNKQLYDKVDDYNTLGYNKEIIAY